jgi:peptide/nickel transport system ATP-binding protein
VVETGSAAAIFAAPAHPYTRGLLACIPVPGRTRRGERLGTIPGMVPSLIGKTQGCTFAGRCAYAIDACRQSDIRLEPVRCRSASRALHPPQGDRRHGGAESGRGGIMSLAEPYRRERRTSRRCWRP